MMDVYFYVLKVSEYWKLEYPDKHIGENALDIYDNKEIKGLVKNCFHLNWPVPRCCGRINEAHFSKNKGRAPPPEQ